MSSLASSSYQPSPDQWHWELRSFFLYFLVREKRFGNAIERLKPHWQRVLEALPDLDPQVRYHELPVVNPSLDVDPNDPLLLYILLVQASVSEELRCRINGLPASWVCFAVHASINGTALDMGYEANHWLWLGELQIPISSTGSAFTVRKINGHVLSNRAEAEDQAIVQPHAGTPFNQWKKLKKQAHQELDRLLSELRDQVEGKTGEWPKMYQKGRGTRTQVTMEKLVQWIVGREEQFAGDRSATNALLGEIGLDPPVFSKKF